MPLLLASRPHPGAEPPVTWSTQPQQLAEQLTTLERQHGLDGLAARVDARQAQALLQVLGTHPDPTVQYARSLLLTLQMARPLLDTVPFDFDSGLLHRPAGLAQRDPASDAEVLTLRRAARGYATRLLAAGVKPRDIATDLQRLFVGDPGRGIAPLWQLPPGMPLNDHTVDVMLARYADAASSFKGRQWPAGELQYWQRQPFSADAPAPWPMPALMPQQFRRLVEGAFVPQRFMLPNQVNLHGTRHTVEHPINPATRPAATDAQLHAFFGGEGVQRRVLPVDVTRTSAYESVQAELAGMGYRIADWDAGLAVADGARNPVRIGKLLKQAQEQATDNIARVRLGDVQALFERRLTSRMALTVSRDTFDVAACSTGRGWTSCTSLDLRNLGSNAHTVAAEIEQGSLIVYIHDPQRDPTIKQPVGRFLLKPYRNDQGQTFYMPARNYGLVDDGARAQAVQLIQSALGTELSDGEYRLDATVYADAPYDTILLIGPGGSSPQRAAELVVQRSNPTARIVAPGVQLSGATLRGLNLAGAQLAGAELRYTDFSGSLLLGADFSGANLHGANLEHARLTGVSFRGANLRGADLSGTELHRVDLEGADVSQAIFGGESLRALTQFFRLADDAVLPYLTDAPQERLDLQVHRNPGLLADVRFREHFAQWLRTRTNDPRTGPLLNDMNLAGMDLSGADLRGAQMTHVNLINTNLSGANLEAANLERATLGEKTSMAGANLSSANLTNALIKDIRIDWRGATLRDAVVIGTDLLGMVLVEGMDVTGLRMDARPNTNVFQRDEFVHLADASWQALRTADDPLAAVRQTPLLMRDPRVREHLAQWIRERPAGGEPLDLSNLNLSYMDLSGAQLQDADLESVALRGTVLDGAQLQDARLRPWATYAWDPSIQVGLTTQGLSLRGADLSGANLRGAGLGSVDMDGVRLDGAYLGDAVLDDVSMRGARLVGADIRSTLIRTTAKRLEGLDLSQAYTREQTQFDVRGSVHLADDFVLPLLELPEQAFKEALLTYRILLSDPRVLDRLTGIAINGGRQANRTPSSQASEAPDTPHQGAAGVTTDAATDPTTDALTGLPLRDGGVVIGGDRKDVGVDHDLLDPNQPSQLPPARVDPLEDRVTGFPRDVGLNLQLGGFEEHPEIERLREQRHTGATAREPAVDLESQLRTPAFPGVNVHDREPSAPLPPFEMPRSQVNLGAPSASSGSGRSVTPDARPFTPGAGAFTQMPGVSTRFDLNNPASAIPSAFRPNSSSTRSQTPDTPSIATPTRTQSVQRGQGTAAQGSLGTRVTQLEGAWQALLQRAQQPGVTGAQLSQQLQALSRELRDVVQQAGALLPEGAGGEQRSVLERLEQRVQAFARWAGDPARARELEQAGRLGRGAVLGVGAALWTAAASALQGLAPRLRY